MAQSTQLTTGPAAEFLGVSPETLRRWAEERKIRHVRLPGGQLRFDVADLEAILTPVEPAERAGATS